MSRGFLILIQASLTFTNKWHGSEFQRSSTRNWNKTRTKQKSQEYTRQHEPWAECEDEGKVKDSPVLAWEMEQAGAETTDTMIISEFRLFKPFPSPLSILYATKSSARHQQGVGSGGKKEKSKGLHLHIICRCLLIYYARCSLNTLCILTPSVLTAVLWLFPFYRWGSQGTERSKVFEE